VPGGRFKPGIENVSKKTFLKNMKNKTLFMDSSYSLCHWLFFYSVPSSLDAGEIN
jgi:hypothetical protein